MGCNGNGHHASCECGWGGVFHASSSSQAPVPGAQPLTLAAYTDPTARCPVCDARVFFYRSPDNGRVFFDQLGPPWPKHECTTRDIWSADRVNTDQRQTWLADWRPIGKMERRTYLGKHHYLLLQDAETGADIVTSWAAGATVKSVQNAFLRV